MKELAIGEVGEIGGVKVRCLSTPELAKGRCMGCIGEESSERCNSMPCCYPSGRKDKAIVHFEAVTE